MRTRDENKPFSPPAGFRQTSPYTLERQEGTGLFALVGLVFFLAGIFIALVLTRVLPYEFNREWGPLVLALLSLGLIAAGVVAMFGRRWLTLDLAAGLLIRQRGLLAPMQSEKRRLNEFSAVVIAFDRGDSESPERYPVRLRAVTGKDFVISKPVQFGESRKQAECLCRFLHLPLVDTTTDNETVVSHEKSSDSLQDRLFSGDARAEPALLPREMLSEVNESGGTTTIVMPVPNSLLIQAFAASIIGFLIVIPALHGVLSQKESPNRAQVGFVIVFALVATIPLISAGLYQRFGSKRKRTTVKASPAGLAIERRTIWQTKTEMVPASDIIDLDYGTFEAAPELPGSSSQMPVAPTATAHRMFTALRKLVPNKGIVVKSRQRLITFGEGLPAGELQYLKWVLRKALARR